DGRGRPRRLSCRLALVASGLRGDGETDGGLAAGPVAHLPPSALGLFAAPERSEYGLRAVHQAIERERLILAADDPILVGSRRSVVGRIGHAVLHCRRRSSIHSAAVRWRVAVN